MLCFLLLSSCYRFYDFAMHSLYCSYRKPLLLSLVLPRELSSRSFTPSEKNFSYSGLPVLSLTLGSRVPGYSCAPHSASGDIPVPPVSLHLKEAREGEHDLFCLLRWTIWDPVLWDCGAHCEVPFAFSIEISSGLSLNLCVIEVGELFSCSPKKMREGKRKIAVSSSSATDQFGYCL